MFAAPALAALLAIPPAPAAPAARPADLPGTDLRPTDLPGLVCFWDFQGGPGADLTAAGPHRYTLAERRGPLARVGGGVFGPHAVRVERGQWLSASRADAPALMLAGDSEVSVVAWVRRPASPAGPGGGDWTHWQYLAGVWNERDAARQYALFLNGHRQSDGRTLARTPCASRVHGYVSDVGGATPGKPFCFSYATGATEVPAGEWATAAFTYDGAAIRTYLDGELDANGAANPFPWDRPIFDGGPGGADFTVGQRPVPSWPDFPDGEPGHPVGFVGDLGGLAVFRRALSADEIAGLHAGAAAPR